MPWASTWTSGWSSSAPSASLSWAWATTMGSECPPCHPDQRCGLRQGPWNVRDTHTLVSAETQQHAPPTQGRGSPASAGFAFRLVQLRGAFLMLWVDVTGRPVLTFGDGACLAPGIVATSASPEPFPPPLLGPAWRRTSSPGESSSGRPCVNTLGWKPLARSPGERVPAGATGGWAGRVLCRGWPPWNGGWQWVAARSRRDLGPSQGLTLPPCSALPRGSGAHPTSRQAHSASGSEATFNFGRGSFL